jgi:hypothetical protein
VPAKRKMPSVQTERRDSPSDIGCGPSIARGHQVQAMDEEDESIPPQLRILPATEPGSRCERS